MITLRNYTKDDAERLVLLANNKNVSRYLTPRFPYPYTLNDAYEWIEKGAYTKGTTSKVIEFNSQFVGGIGLIQQEDWRSHIAEIGYWIGEPFWGKGIATEAVKQMTALGFGEFGYRKIIALVLAPNLPSVRVLEKCGYTLEAKLKDEVCKNGQYFDVLRYAKYSL
ncbi:MAG: N-acetyltransferase [Candidatus Dadabacteria bacterium]|nr:MAG: N-acetyltransferase [Candidatus Dadabacteria bacterium]